MSNFTKADRLLQWSVSVSFIDKSVIAKTVHFVQQQSHEQKTVWKNLNFACFCHFNTLGQCPRCDQCPTAGRNKQTRKSQWKLPIIAFPHESITETISQDTWVGPWKHDTLTWTLLGQMKTQSCIVWWSLLFANWLGQWWIWSKIWTFEMWCLWGSCTKICAKCTHNECTQWWNNFGGFVSTFFTCLSIVKCSFQLLHVALFVWFASFAFESALNMWCPFIVGWQIVWHSTMEFHTQIFSIRCLICQSVTSVWAPLPFLRNEVGFAQKWVWHLVDKSLNLQKMITKIFSAIMKHCKKSHLCAICVSFPKSATCRLTPNSLEIQFWMKILQCITITNFTSRHILDITRDVIFTHWSVLSVNILIFIWTVMVVPSCTPLASHFRTGWRKIYRLWLTSVSLPEVFGDDTTKKLSSVDPELYHSISDLLLI